MSYLTEAKALKHVTDPRVKQRVRIERKIAVSLVDELLEQGFKITVNNGGDEDEITKSGDRSKILDAMWETDEERIFVYNPAHTPVGQEYFGWLYLVYGNDGWDVLSDYTTNLEPFIPKTKKLIDSLS